MNEKIKEITNHISLVPLSWFWIWILLIIGEPDLLDAIIELVQSIARHQ